MLGISISWLPYFAPDKGNTSFLEVEKTPMFRIANGDSWEYISFTGADSFHPASRAFGGFWKLYLQDGTQIHLDARNANTAWIEDRNGNKTTITPDGIEHWSGRRINITRDKNAGNRITSIRDAMNQTVSYGYDALGNLTSVTDRMGKTTTLAYHLPDANVVGKEFLLKSISDAAGREQLLAAYTDDRRLESLKDAGNFSTNYKYDIRKREQSIDVGNNGAANDIQLLLDRRGNPIKSIDAAGSQTLNAYDKDGHLLEQRQVIGTADGTTGIKDDLVSKYSYNEFGQPVIVTDARGSTTQYIYDDKLHQVTTVVTAGGLATKYDYDTKGNLLKAISPTGDKTMLSYLTRGQVDTVRNTDGLLLVDNEYYADGSLKSTKDTEGRITEFEYDRNGRQTARISYEKDVNGAPLTIRKEKEYDFNDRVVGTKLYHGALLQWSASTTYDPETGLVRSEMDQHELHTEYFYDRRGSQIQVRREVSTRIPGANGTFTNQNVWTSQWTVYDDQGRVLLSTDTVRENALQSATSPEVGGNKTIYDAAGRVIGTQRLSNVVVKVDDASGAAPDSTNYHSLRSSVIANGTVITSTETVYDNAGRAFRTRDANGLWSETFYGFSGEVVQSRTQSKVGANQFVWLVSRTAYDDLGRAILTADSALETTTSATGTRTFYDEMGRSSKVERRIGVQLTLLDRFGAVVRDASNSQGPYSIRIDNQGLDSGGNINLISRSLSTYDSQGKLIKTVSGIGPGHDGVETRYEYDARGRQVRQIGAAVQTVEAKEKLRLISETEHDNQGRAFRTTTNIRGRDVGGEMLIDKRFAQSTTQVYDNVGRAYKTIQPDGSFTQVEFDAWGNVVKESPTVASNATVAQINSLSKVMSYDSNGRLIAVTLPAVADPLDSDGDGNATADSPRFDYAFDWAGNQTVLQDALGRRTMFAFNAAGQQITRTLPSGITESFTYNDRGQQVTHTTFEGIKEEFVYDNGTTNLAATDPAYHVGSGRLTEQQFYDPAFSSTVAKEVWKFNYDEFGRKTAVERPSRSVPDAALVQTRLEQWFFDSQGRLIQEAKPEGVINYAYDSVTGQKIRMWTTKAVGLAAANLADAVDDTRYSYNELGWLTGVTVVEKNDAVLSAANQEKTAYGYDLQGRQLRIDLPDGVIQTTEVNQLGAITHMRQYAPDKTPYDLGDNAMLADYLYTLDASGQRTKMVETFWFDADNNPATPTVPKSTTYDWTYDNDSRLTSESIDSFDNAVDRTDSFVMDLFGNRQKRTTDLASTPGVVDAVIRYWYDSNDRLQSEAVDYSNDGQNQKTTTYSWNGTQQAAKTVEQNGSTASTQQFSYDLQGRLASVVTTPVSGAKTRVEYGYDSNSIRISATEFADANGDNAFSASEQTSTTEYLIDDSNFTGYAQTIVETSKNAAGQPTKRISYTFGTDEVTQTTVTYDSAGLPSPASSLTFGHDAHGSVRVLFDAVGALSQAFTYAAYGELLSIHNGIAQADGTVGANGLEAQAFTNLLYSGESFDSRIGQQYLRARWYQTEIGRFERLDPYAGNNGDPLSFNKYLYGRSNSIAFSDPNGENYAVSVTVGFAIVGAISGGVTAYYAGYDHPLEIAGGAALGALLGAGVGFSFVSGLMTLGSAKSALAGATLVAGLLGYAYYSENSFGRPANAKETATIGVMNASIVASPSSTRWATLVTKVPIQVFEKSKNGGEDGLLDAWGYDPHFVLNKIYLSDQLLANVRPSLGASTIVHELVHTQWSPLFKASYQGEKAAYQEQSDYLRSVGISGRVIDVVRANGMNDHENSYLTDLAESFKKYEIENAAVLK